MTIAVGATASFEVPVDLQSIADFASLSGDWNPLHTDAEFAAKSRFRRQVLHGAHSAGLISRLAGMYLPGEQCLLHSMHLRFVMPVLPPTTLRVSGEVVSLRSDVGQVEATVVDAQSGVRYVDASYEFAIQSQQFADAAPRRVGKERTTEDDVVLVTGASGGLGASVLAQLGPRGIPISRTPLSGAATLDEIESADGPLDGRHVAAIVHCGWPAPDNTHLTRLEQPETAVGHFLASPIAQTIALARVLRAHGRPNSMLVLVGSTAADPGRHAYKAPLYSLGKSLVPQIARILAVELAGASMRCVSVVFDVIETGMNARLAPRARLAHVDRSPHGRIATADDAAAQIRWILDNPGYLLSGASITLSGAAIP